MRRALPILRLLPLLSLLIGCSRSPPAQPAPAATLPVTSAAALPGEAPAPVAPQGRAWVVAAAALRREPSEAPRVTGKDGKPVANVLAVLMRGEPVTRLEARGDWTQVRTSGDEPGWLKQSVLLEVEGASVATVLQPVDVFDRPDLLAANPARRLPPGAILLVVRQRALFAEVNAGSGPDAWVLADRLASGDREVSAAKLCEKARWLERSGRKAEALQVLAMGRATFPGAPLLDVLGQELGEPAAEPAAPPAPAPGAAPGPASPVSPSAAPAPPAGPPAGAPKG